MYLICFGPRTLLDQRDPKRKRSTLPHISHAGPATHRPASEAIKGSSWRNRYSDCRQREAWQEGKVNVQKLLVAAAFALTCSFAQADSFAQAETSTSLLDDMRAHPEKYGCSRTNGEGFSCPATVPQASNPADDKSWGEVVGQYFKPLKRWLWDHAPK